MIKEIAVTIGEQEFRIQQMSATKGTKYFIKMAKIFSGVAKGAKGKKLEEIMNIDISGVVEGLFAGIDEEGTFALISGLIKHGVVFPASFNMDIHFIGKYDEMFQLVFEILKLNYEESFKNLKKKVEAIQGAKGKLAAVN